MKMDNLKKSFMSLLFVFASSTLVYAEEAMEEIVVTGSYIKGTAEDAALPVDVLNRADLEDVGNPTLIEMVRNMGVTSGNLGETNQFDTRGGQANEGVVTANLRGLGSARTLVLINNRRHVATESIGVDISMIPSIAIERVEVLKDGAAATYGSDAIGGVVNFITREGFEGLEVRGSFMDIQDSDGDTSIGIIYGGSSDNASFAVSAEYAERSELKIKDRDWALRPFAENPSPGGWSSIGNPGSFFPGVTDGAGGRTLLGAQQPDPNCSVLGGFVGPGNFCRFQYTFFDNLIEDQEDTKLFAEINVDMENGMEFHMEALWHEMDMPEWKTSPSYPPQALLGNDRFIQANHPGLVDLKAQNPGLFVDRFGVPAAIQGASTWSRMLGVAGRNGQPESSFRETRNSRVSFGLSGDMNNGISFDASLTWSNRERSIGGSDMYIERMAFALDGLGGPGCDPASGTPGAGSCEYYNPFSNAVAVSAVTGAQNPQYNPAVANSGELINWLTASTGSVSENDQIVLEAIFTGDTEWELQGGNAGWAAGLQYRKDDFDFTVEDVANRSLNPCPFTNPASITLGHTTTLDCGAGGAGQLAFLAATDEESTDRKIYAVFAELALPVSDSVDMQIAARYEDYGDDGGSSFDPKIAVSWNANENFTLRGSASTTFRGPPSSFLSGTGTALAFIAPALAFKALDTTGNPDLESETATALNVGAIFKTDSFYGSVDYWRFDFDDPFQVENGNQLVGAYGAQGCADGGAGVGSATCDALRARLTPLGTSVAGIQRIQRFIINGADIKTSGIDFVANFTWDEIGNGQLSMGVEGTYQLEYESDDFVTLDGLTLASGGDFVGLSNEGVPFTPLPELKGNIFVKWSNDQHRVAMSARYVDGYFDDAPDSPDALRDIDDHTTIDVTYTNNMLDDLTISLSVFNLTDEDPPQVANDLNYDPYNHSAFGRMIKLGLTYRLGD
ncbi:MAG: TonB-dependent receptor [Gammaproteobacteria bacterium]|nr:TonB-dependent receptor [Gammaproteobacteria bacterium]